MCIARVHGQVGTLCAAMRYLCLRCSVALGPHAARRMHTHIETQLQNHRPQRDNDLNVTWGMCTAVLHLSCGGGAPLCHHAEKRS